VLTLAVFFWGVYLHIRKYRRGRAVDRFDRPVSRILHAVQVVARNATLTRTDLYAGLGHLAIMWGFFVLFLGTAILTIDYDVVLPINPAWRFWKGGFYLWYSLTLDLFGLVLLGGLVMMMLRRALFGLPQLDYARAGAAKEDYDRKLYIWDDWIFLGLLFFTTLTGFLAEGVRIAQSWPAYEQTWSPVGWATASLLARMGVNPGVGSGGAMAVWWTHALLAMVLVAYIPYSKAFHVVVDFFNLVFHNEDVARNLASPAPDAPAAGYERIEDFTWKELLDLDACTRCGRCHAACPAQTSDMPFSPRDMILDLREYADAITIASRTRLDQQRVRTDGKMMLFGARLAALDGVALAGGLIRSEALWSCTTCMACMDICPVGIEHVPLIVQLRRALVQRGETDKNLTDALQNLQRYGNSFGQSERKRAVWTQGLEFKPKDARKEPAQWLWYLGEYACYHPALQGITRSLARVLRAAEVDYGILYEAERNSGNDVRRVGEEGLFELLREKNTAVLKQAKFNDVLTTDPHVYNTLKNEYADLNHGPSAPLGAGRHGIYHYSEVLANLLERGRLKPARKLSYCVTYHDPCYLGRYNGVYDAPRAVLKALGVQLKEMPRSRRESYCCGGGGGRVWMEEIGEAHSRPSESRVREAASLEGVQVLVVACPKDYVMFADALKTTKLEGRLVLKDLVELVEEAMVPASASKVADLGRSRAKEE
jgi:Fe-S oxidoreductase/nitrate reductase gamma subunit